MIRVVFIKSCVSKTLQDQVRNEVEQHIVHTKKKSGSCGLWVFVDGNNTDRVPRHRSGVMCGVAEGAEHKSSSNVEREASRSYRQPSDVIAWRDWLPEGRWTKWIRDGASPEVLNVSFHIQTGRPTKLCSCVSVHSSVNLLSLKKKKKISLWAV
jgi:hypothetical protein